ncbi:hypothetical protein C8Q74DRAFT_1204433, partial [Fomes fomentarius]
FYTRAHHFMDAYHRGLDGKQAAWAAKKYRSHRVLPNVCTVHCYNTSVDLIMSYSVRECRRRPFHVSVTP